MTVSNPQQMQESKRKKECPSGQTYVFFGLDGQQRCILSTSSAGNFHAKQSLYTTANGMQQKVLYGNELTWKKKQSTASVRWQMLSAPLNNSTLGNINHRIAALKHQAKEITPAEINHKCSFSDKQI